MIAPVYEKGYPCYEAVNRGEPQERYHDYVRRKEKEMRELREDHMDHTSLNAAMNQWALDNNMTVREVEELINESPESRQLILKRYWESKTL